MNNKTMRLQTVYFASSDIDGQRGLIKNIAVCTMGEAKGHGVIIDSQFINDVVTMGNAKSKGVKARFGHPEMFATSLGKYIGKVKEFWRDGNVARGNLYLATSAKKSPQGNLFDYVLELAKNDSDSCGMSICFDVAGIEEMEDGAHVRISDLTGCDLVDEPAANDALFEAKIETQNKGTQEDMIMNEVKEEAIRFGKALDDMKIMLSSKDAEIVEINKKLEAEKSAIEAMKTAFEAEKNAMLKTADEAVKKLSEEKVSVELALAAKEQELTAKNTEIKSLNEKLKAYKGAKPVAFNEAEKAKSEKPTLFSKFGKK